MKKLLFQFALFLLLGGWCTEAFAAWVVKGDPIKTVSGLMARLQANDGSALFVMEPRSLSAYWGYYYTAPASLEQFDFIGNSQVIEIVDAKATGTVTGAPQVMLRSHQTGNYWGASAPQAADSDLGAFTYTETTGFKLDLLDAHTYAPADGEGNSYTEDDDAILFCGNPMPIEDENYNAWSYIANLNGTIGYWVGSSMTKYTQFYVYEVEDINSPFQDLSVLYATYLAKQNTYLAGEGLGFCDSAAVEAFGEAMAAAQEVLANVDATDDEYIAAAKRIEDKFEAMKATFRNVEDGHYYYVLSAYPEFENKQGVKKAWYKDASAVKWKTLDRNNIAFLFKFIKQEDGSFAIQSVKDGTYLSGYTTTSADITTTQSVWPTGEGAFYIINGAFETTGSTDVYHGGGHASGAGVSGVLTNWYSVTGVNSASSWTFEEFTAYDKLDSMRNVETQRVITEAFNAQLAAARADSAAGYVTSVKNVITSVDQLSSNAEEPTGWPLANLIDGNINTFFHSTWTIDVPETHYLQVALNEPLQKFNLYWHTRNDNNNAQRPTFITILGSNDGESFDSLAFLSKALDNLPTLSSTPEYYSREIDLGAPYKYVRFRVDTTNTNTVFFAFAEFAICKGFPLDPDLSMGLRPDMLDAYAALKVAIDDALAKNPATVTEADVEALKTAIAAFHAVYPDTTALSNALARNQDHVANAMVAVDAASAQMGQCTDEAALTALQQTTDAVRAALTANPKMTRAEIDQHVAELDEADNKFLASVVMPKPNTWYYMESLCTAEDRTDDGTYGSLVYPAENRIGANILWGDNVENGGMSVKYVWQFVPVEGKEGVYAVQNVGTGYYMGADRGLSTAYQLSDTIVEFRIHYVAGGQLSIIQNENAHAPAYAQLSGTLLVPWSAGKNSAAAWTFVEVADDEQASTVTALGNRAAIYCLPYDVNNSFYAYGDESGEEEPTAYAISGARFDDNKDITAIGLKAIEDEVIPAGTPFILILGDLSQEAGETFSLDLGLVFGSSISTDAKTVNGLAGVMSTTSIDRAGIGYFSAENGLEYLAEGAKTTIAGQTGYIDGRLLAGASEDGDLFLEVKNGVITKVADAKADAGATVTVYSVDGQVVRHGVKAADALKGLAKGIYVINGKSVLVNK